VRDRVSRRSYINLSVGRCRRHARRRHQGRPPSDATTADRILAQNGSGLPRGAVRPDMSQPERQEVTV
jgi:hypothetical protein